MQSRQSSRKLALDTNISNTLTPAWDAEFLFSFHGEGALYGPWMTLAMELSLTACFCNHCSFILLARCCFTKRGDTLFHQVLEQGNSEAGSTSHGCKRLACLGQGPRCVFHNIAHNDPTKACPYRISLKVKCIARYHAYEPPKRRWSPHG